MISTTLGASSDGAFYRVIVPALRQCRCPAWAARRGGRFNRPDRGALYLSLNEATALAEYKQDNPWLRPGTICTFFVNGLRVADLSAGYDPGHWLSLWADFAMDWRAEWFGKSVEPPTWYIADDVVAAGLDGILFPSQARRGRLTW